MLRKEKNEMRAYLISILLDRFLGIQLSADKINDLLQSIEHRFSKSISPGHFIQSIHPDILLQSKSQSIDLYGVKDNESYDVLRMIRSITAEIRSQRN